MDSVRCNSEIKQWKSKFQTTPCLAPLRWSRIWSSFSWCRKIPQRTPQKPAAVMLRFVCFLWPISAQISKGPFNGTNGKEAFKAAAASSVWVCERHSTIALPPANRWVGAATPTASQSEDSVRRAGSITRHYSDAHGTLARQKPAADEGSVRVNLLQQLIKCALPLCESLFPLGYSTASIWTSHHFNLLTFCRYNVWNWLEWLSSAFKSSEFTTALSSGLTVFTSLQE